MDNPQSGCLSEQEAFWARAFLDDYVGCNVGDSMILSSLYLFTKVLNRTGPLSSVIELGCNRGINLLALQRFLPDVSLTGLDFNQKALRCLQDSGNFELVHASILEYDMDRQFDLMLISGGAYSH